MKVHEITACPVCGAEQASDIRIDSEHTVRQCGTCGAAYSPAYADPEDIYVDDYLLGKGEQESPFGIHFDMLDARFQQYLTNVSHARMAAIEDVVGGRGSFLDVGCGTGEVMAIARDRGWQTVGVEPIPKEAAFARDERGLDVRTALLEESGLPEASYDVVGAFHVLEHMPQPTEFLRTISRWAKPGGYVAIEVPNFNSRLRRRSERFGGWRHLRPLEHITHFTPPTLRDTFTRAGLQSVAVTSPTYVGPPQTTTEALDDLVRRRWQPGVSALPAPLRWRLLQALDRRDDRADGGMVCFGVARVPA